MCDNELFPPIESNELNLAHVGEDDITSFENSVNEESFNVATGNGSSVLDGEVIDMHSMECGIMSIIDYKNNFEKMSRCQLRALKYVQ